MLTKEQRDKEIADKGFTVVQDNDYQNVKSRIVIKCEHGHLIETCREDFRKPSFECPKCARAHLNAEAVAAATTRIPSKAPGTFRIIGFDQATERFGVSIFDNGKLVYYSLYQFSGLFAKRLAQIRQFVRDFVIAKWQPDKICFEDIQYEHSVITYKILAQLLGVITALCENANIDYDIVYPSTWRQYAGTAGKNRKEEKALSIAKVQDLYGITVSDDVAEAILIGRYAVRTTKFH